VKKHEAAKPNLPWAGVARDHRFGRALQFAMRFERMSYPLLKDLTEYWTFVRIWETERGLAKKSGGSYILDKSRLWPVRLSTSSGTSGALKSKCSRERWVVLVEVNATKAPPLRHYHWIEGLDRT
jgi:hypothetical protein